MNRVIKDRDLNAVYVTGPGHGGPGLVSNAYLEGTYSEVYSAIGRDDDGLRASRMAGRRHTTAAQRTLSSEQG